MTKERKKIDSRKIIYRKLRQPNNDKKNIAKMAILAVLVIAFALVAPGLCTGIEISAGPNPELPVHHDPDPGFDVPEPEVQDFDESTYNMPSKLQPETPGISGYSSDTYHV